MLDTIHGMPIYKARQLVKINALRLAASQPNSRSMPILNKSSVLFVTAASRNDEPNSCYNCHMFNETDETCAIHSPTLRICKFIYPAKATEDAEPIEYWPVCGYQDYGTPNSGKPMRASEDDPDLTGLSWINAPEVGQEYGGTNCGGGDGGDDCDYWMVDSGENKRDCLQGFCRVLQSKTDNGDCCAAWDDDDLLEWREAQALIEELDNAPK